MKSLQFLIATSVFLALSASVASGQTTFSNSAAISLPSVNGGNAGTYPSNITVSGMSGTVSKVTVSLKGLTHPAPDDLDILLVGPGGEYLVIMSDAGGFNGVSGIDINLDDAAANNLPDSTTIAAGTYKPTCYNSGLGKDFFPGAGPGGTDLTIDSTQAAHCAVTAGGSISGTGTFANIFNGINPNGTWKLYIRIDSGPDGTGSFANGWSLTITTAVSNAPTSTTVTSNNNPSFTQSPGNSVTLTATVSSNGSAVTTGTVDFKDGASAIAGCTGVALNGSGQAACATSFSTEGIHQISANYNGATGFGTSSGSLSQTVNNHTTVNAGNQFCNTGSISGSTAFSPYPSEIFTSGLSGSLSKVTVQLPSFGATFPDDLDLLLVGPSGAKYLFMSHVGGGTSVSGINLSIDDAAASALPDTAALATGTYKPGTYNATSLSLVAPAPAGPYSQPATGQTFASVFGGTNPNGTWSLFVGTHGTDAANLAGGWCVTFTTTSDTPTTTTVSSSANPAFTGSSVTITAHVVNSNTSANVTSGTVTFSENGTVLAGPTSVNSSGIASFTTSTLTEGDHVITATYNGVPGSFNISTGTITQRIDNSTTVNGNSFCNTGTLTINAVGNATPYPSHIFVSNLAGAIQKVTVSLNGFTHAFPDDVDMLLLGPTGANLDILSDVGGGTAISNVNLTLDDAAANQLPDAGPLTSGTFRPTAVNAGGTDNFPAPGPGAPTNFAAPFGSATLGSVFNTTNPNGTWSLYAVDDAAGNGGSFSGGWCVNFTLTPPVLAITKTHTGNFSQGQSSASYNIVVTNNGPGSTSGTVTVVEDPSQAPGLTLSSLNGGPNWSCSVATKTCTRGDALASGASYDTIVATFSVASNAAASQTNKATVSGGGSVGAVTASDATTITAAPDLTITAGHTGTFTQGSTGTLTLTVHNIAAGSSTGGTVTVAETLPTGWTLSSFSGSGWGCTGTTTISCTSTVVVSGGSDYPTLNLIVNVPTNSATSVNHSATVSGGGELNTANDTSNTDTITVVQVPATITATAGTPQTATVNTAFTTNMAAVVKDAGGVVIPSFSVTFTAPASGASGTFPGPTNTATVSTNASGVATAPTFTANGTTGSYSVTATAGPASTTFSLTNSAATVQVTVGTNPAGQSFSVDGTTYTSAQTLTWDIGSNHTIATTSPQAGVAGTQYVFNNWSDGGAISHSVSAPSTAATYTANFDTQYQLTTAASPSAGGTVTPASGSFFNAGTVVNLSATANSGYAFSSWTGNVANSGSASTTVTMSAPQSVTANFASSGNPALFGSIASKTGPSNARVWTIQVGNSGTGAATSAQISSLTLTQTGGAACTPVIATMPVTVGDIAPGATATGAITIDFSGCPVAAKFTANIGLSSNGGAATASFVRYNQYQ